MIVSYIALTAVIVFLANLALRRLNWTNKLEPGRNVLGRIRFFASTFMAGVLFANSIPHFIHGISGEYFPAPFFHSLGKGAGTDIVNVLWGLFNFGVGYNLAIRSREMHSPTLFRMLVCSGFTIMSLFLSVVFAKGTFR